jgi:hypothetical protein
MASVAYLHAFREGGRTTKPKGIQTFGPRLGHETLPAIGSPTARVYAVVSEQMSDEARSEPARRMTEPRSAAPITMATVLPLLGLGFIAIALVSTLPSRQH